MIKASKIIDKYNINSEENLFELQNELKKNNIECKIDSDMVYDSAGCYIFSYAIAYIENEKLNLSTGYWESY